MEIDIKSIFEEKILNKNINIVVCGSKHPFEIWLKEAYDRLEPYNEESSVCCKYSDRHCTARVESIQIICAWNLDILVKVSFELDGVKYDGFLEGLYSEKFECW